MLSVLSKSLTMVRNLAQRAAIKTIFGHKYILHRNKQFCSKKAFIFFFCKKKRLVHYFQKGQKLPETAKLRFKKIAYWVEF